MLTKLATAFVLVLSTTKSFAADLPNVVARSAGYDQTDVSYTDTFPDCDRNLLPSVAAFSIHHLNAFGGLGRGQVDVTLDVYDQNYCHVFGHDIQRTVSFRIATRRLDGDTIVPGLNLATDYNLVINGNYYGFIEVGEVGEQYFHPKE